MLLRNSAGIISIAAMAVMIACAGASSSNNNSTGPGPRTSIHTVDLSWTASSSTDISGYNVYRAVYTASCGSVSKINSALITSTSYRDSEVSNGTFLLRHDRIGYEQPRKRVFKYRYRYPNSRVPTVNSNWI
jgi:hypothetical protein